ncbi:MAG: type IV secretory system conjugative DNA transfer family protein, partial [Clostridia bacterium]|nr:type IV secretory system conjugative DNA transfer family protein [Clostridia bacterium]
MISTFNIPLLLIVAAIMGGLFIFISLASNLYGLNGIKNKTVGNGQHGTARWASKKDIKETYTKVDYEPSAWRTDEKKRPKEQGIVVGCETVGKKTVGLIDTGDVHCMMIGAAGVGKTAYWLYPNIEYACASGMSFMTTDTKGDILRNYGTIATKHYGYKISVIDLRNPMRSHGNNLLHLVNKYMDLYAEHPEVLAYKAKAEKYAKIISKTIILSGMDAGSFGQNAYFYDAAEGVLTASILLVAEFCKPEERHIVSVFKIIQELLAPSNNKQQKNQFNSLMAKLPDDHKAKWFAGAALNT